MNSKLTTFASLALAAAFLLTLSCGQHSWEEILFGSSSSEDEGYSSGSYVPPSDGGNSVLNKTVKVGYNIKNSADLADGFTDIVFLLKWYSDSPNATSTFVNEDGTVTVHISDDDALIGVQTFNPQNGGTK